MVRIAPGPGEIVGCFWHKDYDGTKPPRCDGGQDWPEIKPCKFCGDKWSKSPHNPKNKIARPRLILRNS